MRVWICGARGSTPAPGPEFLRYGGHTSCVALAPGSAQTPQLLLDAGTGIRNVTSLLDGQPFRGHILLTHLHWDHFQGLPFFYAGDRDGAQVSLLLPDQPGGDAVSILGRAMSPPHFPITPAQLRGEWTFTLLRPGCLRLGPFEVEARPVPHKGGTTFGYRVSDGISVLTYIPDHCPTDRGEGPDGWGDYHPDAVTLARQADLLLHDSHLTAGELEAEKAFGHAAAEYAVGLGREAGAKRVLLFHHKPSRTDDEIDRIAGGLPGAEPAREGAVIVL